MQAQTHSPASESRRNLGDGFSSLFELVPALDAATRDAVFRVRHEVYCRDLGWEPVRDDGLETDAYDAQSLHLLLRMRATGEPVGCTRLVLTDPADPAQQLPFERSCTDVIDRARVDPAALPRRQIGEVSRLAVMRRFRQRKGEEGKAVSISDDDFEPRGAQSRFPFIPVGLYMGVAAMVYRLGLSHVFLMTEPRLLQHFARMGFGIEQIGEPIEHRGLRAPALLRSATFRGGLRPLVRPLFEAIETEVNAAFADASKPPHH
jgi:N-acyl amino acid synthase of PEP-CTERM/exosortase system